MCGGAAADRGAGYVGPGLSPRVRGSLPYHPSRPCLCRSIPACAGEPLFLLLATLLNTVYPRVCGGAFGAPFCIQLSGGLSPRVRGSLNGQGQEFAQSRSIPACAGEPTSGDPNDKLRRVYPRVCGGASLGCPQPGSHPGLSPRVRGSRSTGLPSPLRMRSIPACAGEPYPVRPPTSRR